MSQNKYLNEFKKYKITYTLIILNILVYIYTAFLSASMIDMDIEVLVSMGALYGPYTVLEHHWWHLLTAIFLHGGMTHLLMNMFSLYLIGRGAENYFSLESYVSIYAFSGFFGGLISLYMHPGSVGVGASGAIFGVFGALAGFFLVHREQIAAHSKAFMKNFAIIIGINIIIGFSIESVDVSAHIAGLLVGFVGGFVLSKNPKWIWHYSVIMLVIMFAVASYLPTQYVQTLF